jgi:hypothetical protein
MSVSKEALVPRLGYSAPLGFTYTICRIACGQSICDPVVTISSLPIATTWRPDLEVDCMVLQAILGGGGDDVHVIDLLGWLNQTKDEEEFMAFSDDEEAGDEGGS